HRRPRHRRARHRAGAHRPGRDPPRRLDRHVHRDGLQFPEPRRSLQVRCLRLPRTARQTQMTRTAAALLVTLPMMGLAQENAVLKPIPRNEIAAQLPFLAPRVVTWAERLEADTLRSGSA